MNEKSIRSRGTPFKFLVEINDIYLKKLDPVLLINWFHLQIRQIWPFQYFRIDGQVVATDESTKQ